jgi:hypothetical protein
MINLVKESAWKEKFVLPPLKQFINKSTKADWR